MNTRNLVLENVRLIFKNFSGAPGKFNPTGNRNFRVILTPEVAADLEAQGFNVKMYQPKNSDDPPMFTLPVAVSYRLYPPKIVLITSNGKTVMSEEDLSILDFASFTNVDVIINPSHYDFDGRQGIKAYLHSAYFTLYEDELEKKYADIPDTAVSSIKANEV